MLEIIYDLILDIPTAASRFGSCMGHCCSEEILPKDFLQKIADLSDLKPTDAEKILSSAFATTAAKDFAAARSLWEANVGIHKLFDQTKLLALQK